MKSIIVTLLAIFIIDSAYSQKIILHRNSGGDQTYQLSSVDSITFLHFVCGDEIRYAGKTYHTVLIGTQCWMKENLDIGTMISSEIHSTNNGIIEKYCYNNNPANCDTYGGLYQWNEAMQYTQTEGAQGICPERWHIPSQAEIEALIVTAGGNGNKLKATTQGYGSGLGTDDFGFSALLGGNKEASQFWTFMHLTMRGHFWSSSLRVSDGFVYRIFLWDNKPDISPFPSNVFTYGFSVRCIKDN